MYIHFESIDNPIDFARKVAEALYVLRRFGSTDNSMDVVRRITEALSALRR